MSLYEMVFPNSCQQRERNNIVRVLRANVSSCLPELEVFLYGSCKRQTLPTCLLISNYNQYLLILLSEDSVCSAGACRTCEMCLLLFLDLGRAAVNVYTLKKFNITCSIIGCSVYTSVLVLHMHEVLGWK